MKVPLMSFYGGHFFVTKVTNSFLMDLLDPFVKGKVRRVTTVLLTSLLEGMTAFSSGSLVSMDLLGPILILEGS